MMAAPSGLMRLMLAQRRARGIGSSAPPAEDPLSEDNIQSAVSEMQPDLGDTTPSALSARFAGARGQEDEPFFERHPYAAGFLAGLAGGQEGVRSLMAAREAYRRRKERLLQAEVEEQRYQEEQALKRDVLAQRMLAPELAGTPEVGEALEMRLEDLEGAEAPEGYIAHPSKPGEFLRKPKEPTRPRPVSVAPGARLVNPETGEIIAEGAPKTGRTDLQIEAAESRDRAAIERAIDRVNKARERSADLNAEMRSIQKLMGSRKNREEEGDPWNTADPLTGVTYRDRYEALRRKNDALVAEINRLWPQVRAYQERIQQRTGAPVTEPSEPEPEEESPEVASAGLPSADWTDAQLIRHLSQDPSWLEAYQSSSAQERTAWLAQYRAALKRIRGRAVTP